MQLRIGLTRESQFRKRFVVTAVSQQQIAEIPVRISVRRSQSRPRVSRPVRPLPDRQPVRSPFPTSSRSDSRSARDSLPFHIRRWPAACWSNGSIFCETCAMRQCVKRIVRRHRGRHMRDVKIALSPDRNTRRACCRDTSARRSKTTPPASHQQQDQQDPDRQFANTDLSYFLWHKS